jgi:hypothetical protein
VAQLSSFRNKIIELERVASLFGVEGGTIGGVAGATQSGWIEMPEFIKYFD